MTLEAITATVAGAASAVVAADHLLASVGKLIPNSTGQLLAALILKRPVRAQPQQKGHTTMAKFNWNTFAQNLMQTGVQAAQTYDAKEKENTSMHRGDYINLGLMLVAAIASGFHADEPAQQ